LFPLDFELSQDFELGKVTNMESELLSFLLSFFPHSTIYSFDKYFSCAMGCMKTKAAFGIKELTMF
jgi:hypothetical protein